jgi:hypothetical protein
MEGRYEVGTLLAFGERAVADKLRTTAPDSVFRKKADGIRCATNTLAV